MQSSEADKPQLCLGTVLSLAGVVGLGEDRGHLCRGGFGCKVLHLYAKCILGIMTRVSTEGVRQERLRSSCLPRAHVPAMLFTPV